MEDWPQLAPANHPNLYLIIIRLRTVCVMPYNNSDNKDQLRSLKSRLTSTFRPRRNTFVGQHLTVSPSPTDSECSTLIDFNTDDVETKGIIERDHGAIMLEDDNCAWVNERVYNASHRNKTEPRSKSSYAQLAYSGATEMIEEDDRAWCMPSKPTRIASSTLLSLSPRRQRAPVRNGLEPEMLDPEDRAWM